MTLSLIAGLCASARLNRIESVKTGQVEINAFGDSAVYWAQRK